ncbi:acidic proline-rich protein PRP25-like [Gouania willdenowi]|uniref:acidic proline-rich protein PRP25-like n=1 Tax=Gouania willdenowi TaxID=441366 RepID=UPI0010551BEA|nr:acidic proline-rich protein PRP25-like [Gouania willdenowi]XP_028298201.1 acidic proline-rich protein PRP25-like [Gouania willdenowi]
MIQGRPQRGRGPTTHPSLPPEVTQAGPCSPPSEPPGREGRPGPPRQRHPQRRHTPGNQAKAPRPAGGATHRNTSPPNNPGKSGRETRKPPAPRATQTCTEGAGEQHQTAQGLNGILSRLDKSLSKKLLSVPEFTTALEVNFTPLMEINKSLRECGGKQGEQKSSIWS